jgi:hypothetical protein
MDIKAYFVTRVAGLGNTLGMIIIASLVVMGTAQAQNAATTSSHASMSGIQSVIIHARDSVQRRLRTFRPRPQQQQSPAEQQPPAVNPSPH